MRECLKHRGTKFESMTADGSDCVWCIGEKLSQQIFGDAERPSDEVLFSREWAL